MDALKSIFSWLGKFLEKTRVVLLNVATAFILIVITIILFIMTLLINYSVGLFFFLQIKVKVLSFMIIKKVMD